VLVPRARLREAEEIAVRKAESCVLGDPYDPATTLDPVANATQRQRIRDYIESGVAEDVRTLTGDTEAPDGLDHGYFVRPTVFSGHNMSRIAREEIFGPVVISMPDDDEADAFRIVKDTEHGLAGAIWAADEDRAWTLARKPRPAGSGSAVPRSTSAPRTAVQALRHRAGRHRGVSRVQERSADQWGRDDHR
jgi:aldehyde dehydrogenase (NAD+)